MFLVLFFRSPPAGERDTYNTTSSFSKLILTGKVLIEMQRITLKHAIILKIISIQRFVLHFKDKLTCNICAYIYISESWDQKVNITASKPCCLLPT